MDIFMMLPVFGNPNMASSMMDPFMIGYLMPLKIFTAHPKKLEMLQDPILKNIFYREIVYSNGPQLPATSRKPQKFLKPPCTKLFQTRQCFQIKQQQPL